MTHTRLQDAAFVAATDTTETFTGLNTHKTILLGLTAKDTINLIVKMQLTVDGGSTWTDLRTIDSLSYWGTGADTAKTIDLTTPIGAFDGMRLIFDINANARALGTTTPTFSAILTKKKF